MKGDRPLQVGISGFEVDVLNSEAEGGDRYSFPLVSVSVASRPLTKSSSTTKLNDRRSRSAIALSLHCRTEPPAERAIACHLSGDRPSCARLWMKGDRPLQVCISGFEVNIPNSEAEGAIATLAL